MLPDTCSHRLKGHVGHRAFVARPQDFQQEVTAFQKVPGAMGYPGTAGAGLSVMEREHQVAMQGLLIGIGLLLILGTFAVRDPLKNWGFAAFGLLFLGVAALWICTDKRVLTQEEEMEQLLIQASQRYQRTGSLAALLDEYRAEGASDLTLSRVRNAGHLLRDRAKVTLRLGMTISGLGLLLVCGSIVFLFWNAKEPELHLLKYGLIGAGAGLGHIGQGLRLHRHARRFQRM